MDQSGASSSTTWPPRRVALATLVVLAIAFAFWLLVEFRLVFFSLFIAIVLSTAIEPLIERLVRLGLPRTLSILLISVLFLLLLIVAILAVAPLLSSQWFTLTTLVRQGYESLYNMLANSSSLLIRRMAEQLPSTLHLSPSIAASQSGKPSIDLVQQALSLGSAFLKGLVTVLSVLLLTGLWIMEGDTAVRFLLLAFPQQHREGIQTFISDIERKVGAYTRGLGLLSLIIGVMAGTAYAIIGLPNALFLAVFAGAMEIVPLVGPLLGAIPAVLVAATATPDRIIWVIIATIIIHASENNLVVPRVMDRAVGVSPVAGLLAFIAFGSIFGFLGALLAIPLAAVIQLTLNRFLFEANPIEQVPPTGRGAISTLRYEAQKLVVDVRKQVREKDTELSAREDSIEDSLEAIAADLDSILAQAEEDRESANEKGQPARNGKRSS